jgi:hypothetical protein
MGEVDKSQAQRNLVQTLTAIKWHLPDSINKWSCFSIRSDALMLDDQKKGLQVLSLWLRMQPDRGSVFENFGNLQYYMSVLAVNAVPFLNPGYEDVLALETRIPVDLLPKRASTIAGWKTKVWKTDAVHPKAAFLRTESQTGQKVASVGLVLEAVDNAVRQQTTHVDASRNRLVVSGAADVQPRSRVDLDHLDPFSSIESRIYVFLSFMNANIGEFPELKEAILPYDSYFRYENNSLLGTEYLIKSHYNCVDNLWFLEHGPNQEKSNKDPISWIENQAFFKSLVTYVVNPETVAGMSMKDLIDPSSFIVTI